MRDHLSFKTTAEVVFSERIYSDNKAEMILLLLSYNKVW